MPAPSLSPPPLDNGLAAQDGRPSPPWAKWLRQLWDTVRGESDLATSLGTVANTKGTQTLLNKTLTPEAWVSGTLGTGMSNYGAGFSTFRCRKLASGLVVVTGLLRSTAAGIAAGHILGTLPVGYRPASQLILHGYVSIGGPVMRYDVTTVGTILFQAGATAAETHCSLEFTYMTDA